MKKLWLIMLAVALAFGLVFGIAGCRDVPEPAGESDTLEISDAAEIGALLTAVGHFGDTIAGGDDPVVKADGNKAIFNYPAGGSPDNFAFQIDFSDVVESGHVALEATFKLVEVKTLTGGFAKIGFKNKRGGDESADLKPYAEYEVVFGNKDNVGEEFTRTFSLNSPNQLPNKAIWFQHNKYGSKPEDQGSDGATAYTIEITKLVFKGLGSVTYVPVTGVNNVPTKSIPNFDVILPELASPSNATSTSITWSITNAGGTNATISGNILKTITAKGTIKVKATVTDGVAVGENFEKEFDIVIGDPNGILLVNSDLTTLANNPDTAGAIADGILTITGTWKEPAFAIGETLSSTNFNYESVTIKYIADKGVRFSLANGGTRLATTLAGDKAGSSGSFEGWDDLNPASPATVANQVTIPITDVGSFDRFIIGSKGESPAKIQILGVYFEKKQVCEYCQGTQNTSNVLIHKDTCFIPVTSIGNKVPTGGYPTLELALPAQAFPSYATNRKILWSGQGVRQGNVFKLDWPDKVTITATVKNGASATTNFVQTFVIDIPPADDIVVLGTSLTSRAFGYGAEPKAGSPGVWTINSGYQRAAFNIGASVYNKIFDEVVLVIKAAQNGRFGLWSSAGGDPIGNAWETFSNGENVTVTIDLSNNDYDDIAILYFGIENTGSAAGDFEIKSVTFKAK